MAFSKANRAQSSIWGLVYACTTQMCGSCIGTAQARLWIVMMCQPARGMHANWQQCYRMAELVAWDAWKAREALKGTSQMLTFTDLSVRDERQWMCSGHIIEDSRILLSSQKRSQPTESLSPHLSSFHMLRLSVRSLAVLTCECSESCIMAMHGVVKMI
jgi:hypothetical protein